MNKLAQPNSVINKGLFISKFSLKLILNFQNKMKERIQEKRNKIPFHVAFIFFIFYFLLISYLFIYLLLIRNNENYLE